MTAPPPIRVRFEEDGQAAVVGAIRDVEKALGSAQNTGRQAAAGTAKMAGANASLATSFRQVAAAIGVVQLARFVGESIQAADAIGKLSQATGVSAETMSVFAFAAKQADVETSTLRNGLRGLSKSLVDLQNGNAQTAAAFHAIGLSAKDLKGLSVDQAFLKIANAQARFADGAGKATAAGQIFGARVGGQLIPLLNDLAGNGFANASAEATKLGLVFSDQATRDADAFTDRLNELKGAAQGLAVQFGLGLAPSVANSVGIITENVAQVGSSASLLGKGIGAVLRTVVALFEGAGQIIATTVSLVVSAVRTTGSTLALLATGNFKAAATATQQGIGEIRSILSTDTEEFSKLGDFLFGSPDDAANAATRAVVAAGKAHHEETQRQQVVIAADAAQAQATRLQNLQKAADDELRLQKHTLDEQDKAAERAYQQGTTSLETFYAERRRIIVANADAELRAIAAKRGVLAQAPQGTADQQAKVRGELAQLASHEQDVLLQKQAALVALVGDEFTERKRIADAVREFNNELLVAQGKQAEAERATLQRRAEDLRKTLTQAGAGNADQQVAEFLHLGETKIALDELERQADLTFGAIDRQVAQTSQLVQAGAISESEGQRRILGLQRDRLPVLKQIREQLVAIQATVTDPTQAAAIQAQIDRIDALGLSVRTTNNDVLLLASTGRDALEQGLGAGIEGLLNNTKSLGDVWKDTARTIIEAINQVIAKLLAQLLVQQLINAASGIFGGGGGGGDTASAVSHALADGGMVSGPGTGTSDSIPAYLSNGEYVLRAAAVNAVGVDALDALNGMRRGVRSFGPARFADGGAVGAAASSVSFRGELGLADGLVGQHIDSTGADDALIRFVTRKRKTLSSLLTPGGR